MKHNRELTYRARELRKNMTRQERRLWFCFLKPHTIKFQTQKVIDNYIVDFYCAKAKLIIELDGDQHYGVNKRIDYDCHRDKELEEFGYKLIRIDNYLVDTKFTETCDFLDSIIRERMNEFNKT